MDKHRECFKKIAQLTSTIDGYDHQVMISDFIDDNAEELYQILKERFDSNY